LDNLQYASIHRRVQLFICSEIYWMYSFGPVGDVCPYSLVQQTSRHASYASNSPDALSHSDFTNAEFAANLLVRKTRNNKSKYFALAGSETVIA
jgi:hypothetical protein